MPVDASGQFTLDLHPKQWETFRACAPGVQNMVLLNGPRWSGKTWAVHHGVCSHLWETDGADFCILTFTQSVGVDSGVWKHMAEIFLPEWVKGDFGMEWIKEPFVNNVTKKPGAEIRNKHGTKSCISLQSLKNEDEVEERFKGKSYSGIWVNELSKFKKYATFDTLKQCLRMPHLKPEEHLLICDTNPDLDLGRASWIWELWYAFRTADFEQLTKMFPDVNPKDLRPLQKSLKLIEFTIDDNLSLSEDKKASLRADFIRRGQEVYDAYYLGLWCTLSEDALFYKVFRPTFHIIGEAATVIEPNPETLVPQDGCFELISGFDPGGVNFAWVLLDKWMQPREKFINEEKTMVEVPCFSLLDELVIVGEDFDLWATVEQICGKMEEWEKVTGKVAQLLWRNWSDRSAFDMRVAFSERYWHQHIHEASGGRIILIAAEKGRGSVVQRIDLFRKLLFEERFFISGNRCPHAIKMCRNLRKGKAQRPIAIGDPNKHIFDAITYAVASECSNELARSSYETRKIIDAPKGRGLVQVPMR